MGDRSEQVTSPRLAQEASPAREEESQSIGKMDLCIANSIHQIEEAWRLVYHSYRDIEIIDPNDEELHTVPHAVSPDTAVMTGRVQDRLVSTLTVMVDSQRGLPLECVYADEIDALRKRDRALIEVGLLADRRREMIRSFGAVRDLIRMAFYYSTYLNTDAIIGVHPHHAPFYERFMSFEQVGPERSYDTVNGAAVVLLHIKVAEVIKPAKLPRGLAYIKNNPIEREFFEHRFDFSPHALKGSALARYLHKKKYLPPFDTVSSKHTA
ncbi:MAG: hypothetical protein GC164_05990 [Phycisphaera sp.]|nr:hypothetical protein [Phycisphaera sp.]